MHKGITRSFLTWQRIDTDNNVPSYCLMHLTRRLVCYFGVNIVFFILFHLLQNDQQDTTNFLTLFKWNDSFRPEMEFRVFVKNQKVFCKLENLMDFFKKND
jgi:hypothetical protein